MTASSGVGAPVEVSTLGEALIVMDPLTRGRLRHVDAFSKRIGGAELNVAVALARLGHRSGWSGTLGDDEFGRQIVAFLRGEGVDVAGVRLDPSAPTGVYFKERRALGQLRVLYYRAGSAASRQRWSDFDVEPLLSTQILHLTGITPALSESCREITERVLDAARERGTPVSFDANVRWRLFEGRDPREVIAPLLGRADLVFASDDEAELLLGGSDEVAVQRAIDTTGVGCVVVHGPGGALVVDGSGVAREASHPVEVVDSVGAGDAFVAGFLSGRLRGWDAAECLRLANACGACAVTVPGDAESMPSEPEALALLHARPGVER